MQGSAVACLSRKRTESVLKSRKNNRANLEGSRHRAEAAHFSLLTIVASNPNLSQRRIADEMGVSLGKANYCMKAVVEKGWVKPRELRGRGSGIAFAYVLTSKGVRAMKQLTSHFLELKRRELEVLRSEIEQLDAEV